MISHYIIISENRSNIDFSQVYFDFEGLSVPAIDQRDMFFPERNLNHFAIEGNGNFKVN